MFVLRKQLARSMRVTEGKLQVSSHLKAIGHITAIRELPSGLGHVCPVTKVGVLF